MDASGWDERYRAAGVHGGIWATEPPRVVSDIVGSLTPGSALDVATGDGRTAVWLHQHGWATTGVDFARAGLELARARAGGDGVDWVEADVRTWEPPHQYDLVVVAYLHLTDNASTLGRIAGWVAPGGHLVVVGHDVENIAAGGHGPSEPDLLYTPELLRAAVEPVLTVTRCERLERGSDDAETRDDAGSHAVDTVLVATG
ncbi:class I SAM-dependent methyltransferase [Diaminobutyricibacter sp. McL0618]|uniref:class I SAM-dependent methyltransferase n=1 Tax=Leifsonia sp. McL0618 TaxID=3415677 RepID=UPI003CEB0034